MSFNALRATDLKIKVLYLLSFYPIKLDSRLSGSLWRRYIIALFSIVVLLAVHHLVSVQSLRTADQDEELINLSGKQRMLSQRTLMFAHRYLVTGQSIYVTETEATIAEFATAHEALLLAADGDARLMALYNVGASSGLDYQVDRFVTGTRALLSPTEDLEARQVHFREIDILGRDVLLRRLDAAVSGFEARANARADWLKSVQRVAFVSSLVLLVAELLLIFLPLHRWILQTISRLNQEANHDALTDLVNRKHFGEALSCLLESSGEDTTIAVLAMDLDGFKAVNDALGHPAGDELLKLISQLLRDQSGYLDDLDPPLIARMGGDEFMVACNLPKGSVVEKIEAFSEGVLSHLQNPITLDVGQSPVTCIVGMSIGFSRLEDAHGSMERLVSNADIALYTSKNMGKGRLTAFREELRIEAEKSLRLETDLRRAVMNGEFRPFFQPQMDLKTGSFEGFDLLMRWEHPEDGLVPFEPFISDAEKIGVLDMIEASIMLSALETVKSWTNEGFNLPRLALSASAPTLRDSEFVDNLLSAVNMFGLQKTAITIEVNESVLIANPDDLALQSIHRLYKAGFGTLIKGFGTGYASLNAVSGLQLQGLKIAGSLVESAEKTDGLKVLRATIAIGKTMGLRVGAAGANTPQQTAMLRDMGCDFVQGEDVGSAMNMADARRFLETLGEPKVRQAGT